MSTTGSSAHITSFHPRLIHQYFDVDDIQMKEATIPVTFLVSSFTLGSELPPMRSADDIEPLEEAAAAAATGDGNAVLQTAGGGLSDVRQGSTVIAPLWAIGPLHREGYVHVTLPPLYELSTFREFKTDPLAANLYLKSPYFFEAGFLIARLLQMPSASGGLSAEGIRLIGQLFRLYQVRYTKVIASTHKKGFELSDVRERVAECERVLLDTYLVGKEEEKEWWGSRV